MEQPFDWVKYASIAVAVHALVLAAPVAQKASQAAKQRVIDVIVMREEKPAVIPPKIEQKPLVQKKEKPAVERKTVPKIQEPVRPPAPQPEKVIERKEAPGGGGNVLDESIVSQVVPGTATGGDEGVGIAGANVAGGKIGHGGGGAGAGTGFGKGSGPGGGAAVQPSGPVDARFGEGDGPQFIYREVPEYPYAARRLGREGAVELTVIIDEKGKVRNIDVVRTTDQEFAQAAIDAVRRSKFAPAKRKGVPVASKSPYTIRFGLK